MLLNTNQKKARKEFSQTILIQIIRKWSLKMSALLKVKKKQNCRKWYPDEEKLKSRQWSEYMVAFEKIGKANLRLFFMKIWILVHTSTSSRKRIMW